MTYVPTPRRKEQRERAWRIFQLRGLYHQVYILTGWRRRVAQWLVDEQLRMLGAETQSERMRRNVRQWELEDETEIPF